MPATSTITTPQPAQSKPSWVSTDDFRAACEHVEEQCAELASDHLIRALVESDPHDAAFWAVELAESIITDNAERRHDIQKRLRQTIGDYARKTVMAWDRHDWQRYCEDAGLDDPNAWPSDETLGIPVNGWRNQ